MLLFSRSGERCLCDISPSLYLRQGEPQEPQVRGTEGTAAETHPSGEIIISCSQPDSEPREKLTELFVQMDQVFQLVFLC